MATKEDAVCANCRERIFWAEAGWWLHLYFDVKCFSPQRISTRKKDRHRATEITQPIPILEVTQEMPIIEPSEDPAGVKLK
jgi:hypothetical protein